MGRKFSYVLFLEKIFKFQNFLLIKSKKKTHRLYSNFKGGKG